MKTLLAMMAFTFLRPCAADIVDALERIYFYAVYDMDVRVWGVGNTYIATKCRGSLYNDQCSFDEFINFIETGNATSEPSYYTFESRWELSPGAAMAIAMTIQEINNNWDTIWGNVANGRTADLGVWTDMGFAIEQGKIYGAQKDINLSRQLKNVRLSLEALMANQRAILNQKLLLALDDSLRSKVVLESKVLDDINVNTPWQEIEWERTVAAHPDMANPKSELFRAVTEEIQKFYGDEKNAKSLTLGQRVAEGLKNCF